MANGKDATYSAGEPLDQQKLEAEIAKLRAEAAKAEREGGVGWLVRSILPALLIAAGTGIGGVWFGDSLLERSRAEIRKDLLTFYFGVENTVVGKRKQILNFLAEVGMDDPALENWRQTEAKHVEAELEKLEREQRSVEEELAKRNVEPTVDAEEPPNEDEIAMAAASVPAERLQDKRKRLQALAAEAKAEPKPKLPELTAPDRPLAALPKDEPAAPVEPGLHKLPTAVLEEKWQRLEHEITARPKFRDPRVRPASP